MGLDFVELVMAFEEDLFISYLRSENASYCSLRFPNANKPAVYITLH